MPPSQYFEGNIPATAHNSDVLPDIEQLILVVTPQVKCTTSLCATSKCRDQ